MLEFCRKESKSSIIMANILNMRLCILVHLLVAISIANIATASSTTKTLGTAMMTNDWMTNETISFMVTSNNTQSTMMTNNWMTNETTSFMETSNNTQSTPTTLVAITRNLTTTQESAVTLSSNVTYSRISTTSQNVTITNMSTVPQTQGQTTSTRANEESSINTVTTMNDIGITRQTRDPDQTISTENYMRSEKPLSSISSVVATSGAPANRNVAIVSVLLVVLLFTLVAVGYLCYKKKNKDDLQGLESGAGRVKGGEKDDGHDRYVLEPTDVKKHMSSNIYGDVGDMADPEFRLSVR